MKPLGRFPIPALTLLIAVSGLNAKNVVSEVTPTEAGIVSGDRVNVRARASLIGERVAQLRKGDKVTVLAKVTVAPPRKGEPTDWLKIAMPAAGQTWVHLSFVKEGKVTAKKLNVRAGGSERFSIVGRLAKGNAVEGKTHRRRLDRNRTSRQRLCLCRRQVHRAWPSRRGGQVGGNPRGQTG